MKPDDCICDFWEEKHRVYCLASIRELEEYQKRQEKLDEEYDRACKDNNIQLIRIPYWDFKNIEQILDRRLFNDQTYM